MKRVILILLSFTVILSVLCSCNKESQSQDAQADPPKGLLTQALSDYVIIYSEKSTSPNVVKEVQYLQKAIESKFGTELEIRDDLVRENSKYTVGEHEILIGETNREESLRELSLVEKINDYRISVVNEKIVVAGMGESAMVNALRALTASISALSDDGKYFFTEDMQVRFNAQYAVTDMLLGGSSISEFTLIYQNTEICKDLAEQFINDIAQYSGYRLSAVADSGKQDVSGKIILLGNTSFGIPDGVKGSVPDCGYYAKLDGERFYLYAEDNVGLYRSICSLTELAENGEGEVTVKVTDSGMVAVEDTSLKAMSFNVLVHDITDERTERVITMIKKHMPDTLGVQEANTVWLKILNERLGDTYAFVGRASDRDGDGGVLYRKDKFTLIESGTRWLSDTPEKVSKVDGSIYNRSYTYVILERKSDGVRFMHINTHADHVSNGGAVRLEQMKALTEFIIQYPDIPIVVSGDFNDTKNSSAISHVLANGMLDSSDVAFDSDTTPTFAQKTIDFLFVSENDFVVYDYTVDNSVINGELPSDHNPVIIHYDIKSQ